MHHKKHKATSLSKTKEDLHKHDAKIKSLMALKTKLMAKMKMAKPQAVLLQKGHGFRTVKGKIDQLEPRHRAMFVPRDFKIPEVPEAAGNEEKFARETASQKRSKLEALGASRSHTEMMKGLKIVSSLMKKRAE